MADSTAIISKTPSKRPQTRKITSQPSVQADDIILPDAHETERNLLGAILLDGKDAFVKAIEAGLTTELFSLPSHQIICTAFQEMQARGWTIHWQTLIDYLKETHTIDKVGQAYIASLMDGRVSNLEKIPGLIKQLDDVRFKRESLKTAVKVQQMAANGATPDDIKREWDKLLQKSPGSETSLPKKKPSKHTVGNVSFEVDSRGVRAVDNATGERVHISGELRIQALTRSKVDDGWSLILVFRNLDNKERTWVMPRSWLTGDRSRYREKLLDMGLHLDTRREAETFFHCYLNETPTERATSVERVGWSEGVYVLPDSTIGAEDGERVYLQTTSGANHLFETSGTLDNWRQNVGHFCIGNSRLLFAVSAAFAASLLTPLGIEGGGFHFMGTSSKGKSTTQYVAGSVWGGDGGKRGFVQTWRATATGMEYLSEYHNDGLLCLDEIGEANPKEIGQIVYALTNGRGKYRGQPGGGLRRLVQWTVLALSSGERTLADYMAEAGQMMKGGQDVRLIHLPAVISEELGLFEEWHGFAGGKDFADHLVKASREFYGTPIRAFLERLITQRQLSALRQRFESFKRKFIADNHANQSDTIAGRAADRFAIVGFAGEIASEWGLTGWPVGEARKAAERLFAEWQAVRGSQSETAQEALIRRVVEFLERHGASRFQRSEGEKIINRAGFKLPKEGEVSEYCISPEVFRSEVCAGMDYRSVAKALTERGHLVEADGKNLAVFRTVPELGRKRFYVVKNSVFGDFEVGQVGQSDASP